MDSPPRLKAMRLLRAAFFLFLLAAILPPFFLASCKRKAEIADMSFPPTFIVEGENRFAVIELPYAVLLDEPGQGGITVSHCRRGDVFEVTATRLLSAERGTSLWVCLEGGWILQSSVTLFSSRAQAESAARAMAQD